MENNRGKWEIHDIDDRLNQQLLQDFRGERSGYLQVGDKRYFFPKKFAEQSSGYEKFKPRPDDTWVVSFPRSGTTWTQEMIWLLCNDLDYEKARRIPLSERFPFLEYHSCVNNYLQDEWSSKLVHDEIRRESFRKICSPAVNKLEKMSSPRFIKTHLPFSLLPNNLLECNAKIIYVARNPKDVAVSSYHQHRLVKTLDFVGDFSKFWDYFERNLILWSPYWEHVQEGWMLRNYPNVLFLFYEELKQDLYAAIKKASEFVGKKYSDEQIVRLSKHLDISNFRKNSAVNMEVLQELGMLNDYSYRHIRRGKNGNWKEHFDVELNARADVWITENLKKTNIKFPVIT